MFFCRAITIVELNSPTIVELVMALEEEFGVLADEMIEQIRSIRQLVEYLSRRANE